jgi:hypothetical protein
VAAADDLVVEPVRTTEHEEARVTFDPFAIQPLNTPAPQVSFPAMQVITAPPYSQPPAPQAPMAAAPAVQPPAPQQWNEAQSSLPIAPSAHHLALQTGGSASAIERLRAGKVFVDLGDLLPIEGAQAQATLGVRVEYLPDGTPFFSQAQNTPRRAIISNHLQFARALAVLVATHPADLRIYAARLLNLVERMNIPAALAYDRHHRGLSLHGTVDWDNLENNAVLHAQLEFTTSTIRGNSGGNTKPASVANPLLSTSQSPKKPCFNWNAGRECHTPGNCPHAHLCRVQGCGQQHRATEHTMKDGKTAS